MKFPLNWFHDIGLVDWYLDQLQDAAGTAQEGDDAAEIIIDYDALAEEDSDNDGYTNAEEFLIGTNPLSDPSLLNYLAERLQIAIAIVDGGVQVDYGPKSSPVATFTLHGAKELDGTWAQNDPMAGNRFFKVVVTPRYPCTDSE